MAVLDTHWHANPKILALGLDAMGLHAWSISYCDDLLTDGFVPQGALPLLPRIKQAVKALLTAGRWEAVEGGYRLHDYLRHNRSKAEVDKYMAAKIAAGQAGGRASAQARAEANGKHTVEHPPDFQAPATPSAQANAKQTLKQNPTPSPGDVNSRPPARLAGRTARPRARGDGDLQPLAAVLPDEVLQRLGRSPIGQPAVPASPSNALG